MQKVAAKTSSVLHPGHWTLMTQRVAATMSSVLHPGNWTPVTLSFWLSSASRPRCWIQRRQKAAAMLVFQQMLCHQWMAPKLNLSSPLQEAVSMPVSWPKWGARPWKLETS